MAIKCIQVKTLSKAAVENLLVEIELLKKLDHDHIVKLKDFQVTCCLEIIFIIIVIQVILI